MSRGRNEHQNGEQGEEKGGSLFQTRNGNHKEVIVALEQNERHDALLLAEKQIHEYALELQRIQSILESVQAIVDVMTAREQRTDDLSSPLPEPLWYELATLTRGARFLALVRSVLCCQHVVLTELVPDGTQFSPLWSTEQWPAMDAHSSDGPNLLRNIRIDTLCCDAEQLARFRAGELLSIDHTLSLFTVPVAQQVMVPLLYQGELFGALALAYSDRDSQSAHTGLQAGAISDPLHAQDVALLKIIIHLAALLLQGEREQREKDRYVQAWQIARDEVEHLRAMRQSCLAVINREFRASLLNMQHASEIIRDHESSNALSKEFALDISADARRIIHMIEHMTDIAQWEDSVVKLYATWLNMNTLITDVIHQWSMVLSRCHLHVQAHLATALPLLRGERNNLCCVINALVDRAIRHTPQGNELIISSHVEERLVYVSVQCRTVHIPFTILENIFSGSFRSFLPTSSADALYLHSPSTPALNSSDYPEHPDSSAATKSSKSSLHEIVARHGGRLWAESTPGKGFEFSFTVRYA
ncbi:HAMP domain-containing histidine kinase [Ktedonobacteria bacterium brp13]|nr:HAMP domain-containing histidine kinase [Ktedonobacteria bacterium brp13]